MQESWGEMTSEAVQALCLSSAPSNAFFRHPLTRRIYLIFFVFTTLLVLLPLWTILYIPRSNRPRQSWTLQRCLRVRWSRRLCGVVARCEVDYLGRNLDVDMDPLKLSQSHPVTIPPAPQNFLRGHTFDTLRQVLSSDWDPHFIQRHERDRPGVWGKWSKDPQNKYGFQPVKAFWFTGEKTHPEEGPKPRNPDEPVILHFHGGGYLCGTAAETDLTSSIAKSLVMHSPVHHILSVDYRLAPSAPWPLPLLDAISAYYYLVQDQKIPESDIIIAGDSAGGHLALALARFLRDEGPVVGMRGARGLVLLSPWSDVGFSNSWGDEAYTHNADSDTIDDTFGPFATSLLLRGLPASTMHTSPYLSPASLFLPDHATGPLSFERFPPTFIVYGEAERLSLSILKLWQRIQLARKLSPHHLTTSTEDTIFGMPDSVHDFVIFPWQAEEAAVVYEKLDEWLRDLLSGDDVEDVEEKAEEDEEAEQVWEKRTIMERRKRRQSLRIDKSPVMRPQRRESGMIRMLGDLEKEGMSMIDITPLDLDGISLPSADSAKEWLTPFTAQQERGDWDWDGDEGGKAWYEIEDGEVSDGSEGRKER